MTEQSNVAPPSAEQILEAGRIRRIEPVTLAQGKVYAWGFKRSEAKTFWSESRDSVPAGEPDLYADERLVLHCIRDGSGKRIFRSEQLTQLADMNQADFSPLLAACWRVNGWGPEGAEAIRKNSEPIRTDGSGSPSPQGSESPPTI